MFDNVKADLRHYGRFCWRRDTAWVLLRALYCHPASAGVLWYRLGSWAWRCRVPLLKQLAQLVYLVGQPLVRAYSGVQIQPLTKIGPGLVVLHFGGVVFAREAEIGENCVFFHNVNIVASKSRYAARIGANFYAGVGTTIVGNVTIEDDVTCAAGSLVTRSIPRNAIVGGCPAEILRFRRPGDDFAENRSAPTGPVKWMEVPPHLDDQGKTDLTETPQEQGSC